MTAKGVNTATRKARSRAASSARKLLELSAEADARKERRLEEATAEIERMRNLATEQGDSAIRAWCALEAVARALGVDPRSGVDTLITEAEMTRKRVAELEERRSREQAYERLVRAEIDAPEGTSTLMSATMFREKLTSSRTQALTAYSDGARSMRERASAHCVARATEIEQEDPLAAWALRDASRRIAEMRLVHSEEEPMTADEWNRRHKVGTPVRFETYRGGPVKESRTRSEAWLATPGRPVVKIEGCAGGVALDHITVIEEATE